jgi:outer membrane protein TolC
MRNLLSILLALVFCGCAGGAARKPAAESQKVPASDASKNRETSVVAVARTAPYTADELAHMAAARAPEARAILIKAAARRYKASLDTAWKDPELRLGHAWSDSDENTPGRYTSSRAHKWEDGDSDTDIIGLRFYFANPFVGKWLRRQGEAEVRALEARARQEEYAVFCEVKTLCQELSVLDRDIVLLGQLGALRAEMQKFREDQAEAGVGRSPLGAIQAETKKEQLAGELLSKRAESRQLRRQIALLAGVKAEGLRLVDTPSPSPSFALLDPASLADLAFLRRPDLAEAREEKSAAEYTVNAAKAGNIPWFDFAEGTYQNRDTVSKEYSSSVNGYDRTTEDSDEWRLRLGITIPLFTWMGDSVKFSRLQLEAAETRAQGLYESVRGEIYGVLEDYKAVAAEYARLTESGDAFCKKMEERIAEMEKGGAAPQDEILKAREELVEYRRVCLKNADAWQRQLLLLETVSGGSLP